MTRSALQFNLIVAMFGAFLLFCHASMTYAQKPAPFHPRPLPNIAANAMLSVFRYDEAAIKAAREIAKPTPQEAMERYDH